MTELIQFLRANIVTFASVLTAIGVIYKAVAVPVQSLVKSYNSLQADVSDLMWDRLSQGHDYYVAQGWATSADKQRLCSIYRHYKASGRDHLADHYEADIMGLPEHPAQKGE